MMEMQEMAEIAAHYVNTTDRHIFLTGKAGTGKTTFLRYIVQNTYKNTVIAAPTGIAAINAGGVTLHSLLQLPFGSFIPENIPLSPSDSRVNVPDTLFRDVKFNATKRKLIQEVELLIIDEVSMLRADLLDCIDHTLRYLRKRRHDPFGGLQILFIGDLMQLPPVVKEEERALLQSFYPSMYFFEAQALKENPPVLVELQKIFRQSDQDFIDLLNRLRHNQQTSDDVHFLNRYYNPDFDQSQETGYIHLTTHNYRADKLNKTKLQNLESELYTFYAHIEGDFPESMYPTTKELHLKAGAQVMFLKNDPSGEGLFFNGKIGTISTVNEEEIWVKFEDGGEVLVSSYAWENKRFSLDAQTNEVIEKKLGHFEQFPIKLAWAVTVHKSQGLTFEKAILDLSGTFAPGQLYVALSRLTSLKGLVLSSPLPDTTPEIDASLETFVRSFASQEQLSIGLAQSQRNFIVSFSRQAFDFSELIRELTYHERSFNKAENRSLKQQYAQWTKELIEETLPLQSIGDKFRLEIQQIATRQDYKAHLAERMSKADSYFSKILTSQLERLTEHRKSLRKESKVKGYIKELTQLEEYFSKQIRCTKKLALLVQSTSENRLLTREELRTSPGYLASMPKKEPKEKKDKTPTSEISYRLYSEGKSIAEIASKRDLAVSTIESHLSKYVENGEIPIESLVAKDRIAKILSLRSENFEGLSQYKAALADDFSYGEIKMVLASAKKD